MAKREAAVLDDTTEASADTATETVSGFADLGLHAKLVATLTELGYEEPTPIQRETIPPLLEGRDLVGQAATGTGKTAAFALPLLHRLAQVKRKDRPQPSALVLVPTRELAMQVAEALNRYGRSLELRTFPIYGGQPYGQQFRALEQGVDVIVATPGRALDHIQRGTLKLGGITAVVLDEADEMLDMGFAEDMEAILAQTPETRQTMLFSATLPPRIASLAKRNLTDPVEIKIAREKTAAGEAPRVRQTAYVIQRAFKLAALGRILDVENPVAALIFCRTRTHVDELAESLSARGYRAEALHGGMSQQQRDRVMKKLRSKTADLVIATDVAARGLDIEQLSHVINYDVPCAVEAYVHRIGRVGRAGREGIAITLAEPREHGLLRNIERATKQKIVVAQVPTLADLRARRLELTRTAIHEALQEGGLDEFRAVVESLSTDFDVMDVALAAVKLVHKANSVEPEDSRDIPSPVDDRDRGRGRYEGRNSVPFDQPGQERGRRPSRPSGKAAGMSRIFIGLGRSAGIRPQDLVGAIAGESGIPGRDIGAIEITDTFSLVDVPEAAADMVVKAMRGALIRGQKTKARLDRYASK